MACPDHRPVYDDEIGWYCAACGAEAPPGAGSPPPADTASCDNRQTESPGG